MAKILSVDADRHIHTILRHVLEQAGHTATAARDKETALDAIAIDKPDLIILGDLIPYSLSIELCNYIRSSSIYGDVGIILLTRQNSTYDKLQALNMGAYDVIFKPFVPDELVLRIRNLVHYQNALRSIKDNVSHSTTVFISYSHEDKAFVNRLTADIRDAGCNVWMDEAELNIGDSLLDAISTAILSVDYVLAIISVSSVHSVWVSRELKIAMTREMSAKNTIVLPAIVGDVEVPIFLYDKYYADFRDPNNYNDALKKVIKRLTRIV